MKNTMNQEHGAMKRAVVAVLLLLFTASIQAQAQAPKPGPEYTAYEVWIGDWTHEGEAQATPLGPAGKFSGRQTVRWILNGFCLEFRAREKGPLGDLEVVEIDWYDAATKTYPYQGHFNNGDMYSATGTVSGNVWKNSGTQTYKGVQYKFRGVITFAADGKGNTWKYEMSPDGKKWVPFHEGKATKVASPGAQVEQELARLEHEWSDAVVKRDVASLDRLLVGEVVLGTAEGKWLSKSEYLAEIKSGEWTSTSEVVDGTSVRVYGDMAVITGRTTSTSQYHGVDSSGQYLWSDTWVKRNGGWQCVASHGSKVPAAPAKSASVEQDLIRLEDGWNEAVVKVDLEFLDRILADDLTDTDDEGIVWTKAQDLANLKSGDYKCTSAVSADRQVRVYGDTAVVTGRNTNKAQYKGVDKSGQYRWTDTWVKRDGRWQCVATHGSKIVKK